MTLPLPQAVGRYEIRREIGRGMMGVVYEAYDTVLGRTIALKTIRLAFAVGPAEEQAFEQRFFTEARIAARLSHPGIVVVHDVGRDPDTGVLFMALEYLDGDLFSTLSSPDAPMAWRDALRLVWRVAEALDHAHEQGVVHRDVKPANVIRLRSGEPKVMDFGIARIVESQAQLTAAGQFFGTPLYMSPEQALGRPVDARSDLFSLGGVAYFLLTGRAAFGGDSVPVILERVMRHEPAPPSRLVPALPPAVDAFVARALAKEPDQRYATGRAMAEDVQDILEGRPPRNAGAPGAATTLPGQVPALGPQAGRDAPRAAAPPAPPTLPLAAGPRPAPWTPDPPAGRTFWPRWGAITLVSLAVLVAAALLARRGETTREPVARVVAETPAAGVEASPPVAAAAGRAHEDAPARLAIDFEHSLRYGRLRVWIDDEAILEEELDSRVTRKLLGFRSRRGSVEQLLEVRPGLHEVRLEVAWDASVRSRRITGRFQPGQDRRLGARLSGLLRKNLDLWWE